MGGKNTNLFQVQKYFCRKITSLCIFYTAARLFFVDGYKNTHRNGLLIHYLFEIAAETFFPDASTDCFIYSSRIRKTLKKVRC
jgi:hypothetical protein